MKSGIYKISFDGSDNIYIGQAVDLKRRKEQHLILLRKNKHWNRKLQRSFLKYNSFIFSVIELCSPEKMNLLEQKHIDLNVGVNLCNVCLIAGSVRGVKRSDETKRKIGNTKIGNQYTKGQKRTPDQNAITSMIAKNNIENNKRFASLNISRRKKINQLDMNGNFIRSFESATYASSFGFDRKSINCCIKGIHSQHKGFKWELAI